jgi:hypothetical protein
LPEPGCEYEVAAIQPLPEKSYTLSVGWSRRILMYHDHAEVRCEILHIECRVE